jgi:hypothetical protein
MTHIVASGRPAVGAALYAAVALELDPDLEVS